MSSLRYQMATRVCLNQIRSKKRRPADSRTIAVMHLLDGFTLQEVADEVGMSVSGVRKRLRKLKKTVHELEALDAPTLARGAAPVLRYAPARGAHEHRGDGMRALIVGAGAVGQVYGTVLQRAGIEVGVYVREARRAEAEAGYKLERLHIGRRATPQRLQPIAVVCSADEVAAGPWDAVWLCVPADKLRGPWLEGLLGAIGDATVVVMQPGPDARAIVTRVVPDAQVLDGLIPFLAWLAPLQSGGSGTAWYLPPVVGTRVSGESGRVRREVDHLRRGGMRAMAVADARADNALGSAAMSTTMAGLELVGWRLDALRGPHLADTLQAAREAQRIAAVHLGLPAPSGALLRPWALGPGVRLGRRLAPLDLEAFLRTHFTKVRAQTRAGLARLLELGDQHGVQATALAALAARLPPLEADGC